jgi:hypothetical protein
MNNRRAGLLLSGLALVALLLVGCGKSSGGASTASTSRPSSSSAQATSTQQPGASQSSGALPSSPPSVVVAPATPTSLLVSGTAGGVTATLHASTHKPKVNRPWPLHFTVTHNGAPVKAAVEYEYLFGGQVVAHRSHYIFTGHFSDVFRWPSTAVGYPLTFRAVITSKGATINLDYPVQVTG